MKLRISLVSLAALREIFLFLFCCAFLPVAAARAADSPAAQPASAGIDNPMFLEPALTTVPAVTVFDPADKALWLAALARPDAENRRQAADAIGDAARQGMPDLTDAAGKIAATLDADTRPLVRQACAQALARMNASQFAATLLKHVGDDWQTMLITDAALAGWNYAPAHAVWHARLSDARAGEMAIRSALRALGAGSNRQADDTAPILAIAIDAARSPGLRLSAAQVLGSFPSDDAITAAGKLAGSNDLADRLVAATMLWPDRMASTNARQLLLQLSADPEPTVVNIAASRLAMIDPAALVPLNARLAGSDDFAVRMLAVKALVAQRSEPSTALLATMMNDSDRMVREAARDALLSLSADPSLASTVSGAAVKMVGSDERHGIEQALLLLGATNDHHADERVLALLSDERPELRIAAVVAVRRLRIQSALPEFADRFSAIMTTFAQREAEAKANPKAVMSDELFTALSEEASQIAQALGEMDYAASDAMMRKLIPKAPTYPGNMRPAAIWALGRFHAGVVDDRLAGELLGRATDHDIQMPESPLVQTMAVETLGRMHAANSTKALQQIIETDTGSNPFTSACRWAIGQITGHTPPPPAAPQIAAHGFFLEAVH